MRVLFDVNHPAQVHLFRNAIREIEDSGGEVLVTSREKEVTTRLLDEYGIDHVPLSASRDGTLALASEWAARELRMFRVARSFDPDVMVGRLNPPLVHVSKLLGAPNVVVMDTEIKSAIIDRCYSLVTHPFIDVYCTPPSIDPPSGVDRHRTLDFQELAYLHPNRFSANADCLRGLGVDPDERYFVVRFAAWDAFHDVGYTGFSPEARRDLVERLDARGTVYVSSEDPLPAEFAQYELPVSPHHVHHLLRYADLYVGDSGTMSSEAAMLGTPSVRANSMVDDDTESVFFELEDRYGLMFSFADERRAIERAAAIADGDVDRDWEDRRRELLSDKSDVTARTVDIIRNAAGAGAREAAPATARGD